MAVVIIIAAKEEVRPLTRVCVKSNGAVFHMFVFMPLG